MINLDLMEMKLQEALFGGPRPDAAEIDAFLRQLGIALPVAITATSEGAKGPGNAIPVQWHHGLVYWFGAASRANREAILCDAPEKLVAAMQTAILTHRRQELKAKDTVAITEVAEAQAFHLALGEMRRDHSFQAELLDQWLEIVVCRHHVRLNEVRRRLIEFLGALTRGVEAPLAYPFYSAMRRILETCRLSELTGEFREICRELHDLISGRTGLHPAGTERSDTVRKAFAYMEAHFTERISLQEVAAAAHVSPPHLARLFRREAGRSVVEYLQMLRISRARELLETTALTTLEIALQSGFESVEHFYRLFRRSVGMTPRNYRIIRRL